MSPAAWMVVMTGIGMMGAGLLFLAKAVAKLTRLVDAVEERLPQLIRSTMRDHVDTMHRDHGARR